MSVMFLLKNSIFPSLDVWELFYILQNTFHFIIDISSMILLVSFRHCPSTWKVWNSFFLSSYFYCNSVVRDFFEWEAGGATADCVSSFSHYSLIPLFPPTLAMLLFLANIWSFPPPIPLRNPFSLPHTLPYHYS